MMKKRPEELDYFHRENAEHFSFYRVPKLLFTHGYYQKLTAESRILYGILLDRMQLSLRNQWYDKKERIYIYYTIREIMERMGCGNQKAVSLLKELEGIGLIEKKRQGRGKPNALYIKNFASILSKNQGIFLCPERCDNHISANVNTTSLEVWKSHSINTDKNKTEMSENNQSYQGLQQDRNKDHREKIRLQISYDTLIHDNPEDQAMIDGLIDLIIDVMGLPDQKTIKISGVDRPVSLVKGQLAKLNMMHIQYILSCMKENTTKIHNIRNYLLAALYNAPMTMDHYYQAKMQHDFYGSYEEGDQHGVPP